MPASSQKSTLQAKALATGCSFPEASRPHILLSNCPHPPTVLAVSLLVWERSSLEQGCLGICLEICAWARVRKRQSWAVLGHLLSILRAVHNRFWAFSHSGKTGICEIFRAYFRSKCQWAFSQGSLDWSGHMDSFWLCLVTMAHVTASLLWQSNGGWSRGCHSQPIKDSVGSFLLLERPWHLTPVAGGELDRETLDSLSRSQRRIRAPE